MLLGIYKSIGELEASISLPELELILSADREREHRHHRFMASLKGIDLDEYTTNNDEGDAREKMEIAQARANARLKGEDPEKAEWDFFGIDIETE